MSAFEDMSFRLFGVCSWMLRPHEVQRVHDELALESRTLDTAAAKKDETAHRKRAPRGCWS